MVVHST